MSQAEEIRLRHMLEAARKAVSFMQGRSRIDLDSDEMLALAVVRLIEILARPPNRFPQRLGNNTHTSPGVRSQVSGTALYTGISMSIWILFAKSSRTIYHRW
jgi:hypothetical protein